MRRDPLSPSARGRNRPAPDRVALVAPVTTVARRALGPLSRRLPSALLEPYDLDSYLADFDAPRRLVLVPAGRTLADDLAFVRSARRRALWPAPPPALADAIAGLRGSHDEPAGSRARRSASSALLLEGEVTPDRARRAAAGARAGAPRDWIVERVQRVRIGATRLEELSRKGIRWSVLEPLELVALAAGAELASARRLWVRQLPAGVPVWVLPARPTPGRGAK